MLCPPCIDGEETLKLCSRLFHAERAARYSMLRGTRSRINGRYTVLLLQHWEPASMVLGVIPSSSDISPRFSSVVREGMEKVGKTSPMEWGSTRGDKLMLQERMRLTRAEKRRREAVQQIRFSLHGKMTNFAGWRRKDYPGYTLGVGLCCCCQLGREDLLTHTTHPLTGVDFQQCGLVYVCNLQLLGIPID